MQQVLKVKFKDLFHVENLELFSYIKILFTCVKNLHTRANMYVAVREQRSGIHSLQLQVPWTEQKSFSSSGLYGRYSYLLAQGPSFLELHTEIFSDLLRYLGLPLKHGQQKQGPKPNTWSLRVIIQHRPNIFTHIKTYVRPAAVAVWPSICSSQSIAKHGGWGSRALTSN